MCVCNYTCVPVQSHMCVCTHMSKTYCRRGTKTSFTVSITAANWHTAWYSTLKITCTFWACFTIFITNTLVCSTTTFAIYTISIIKTLIVWRTYLKFRFIVVIWGYRGFPHFVISQFVIPTISWFSFNENKLKKWTLENFCKYGFESTVFVSTGFVSTVFKNRTIFLIRKVFLAIVQQPFY